MTDGFVRAGHDEHPPEVPWDDGWRDWSVSEVADADVHVGEQDEDYDKKTRKAETDRLEQANDLRSRFFYFAVSMAACCTLGSIITVIALAWTGKGSEGVYIAFISGLSVEALGITAIMARYLFAHPNNDGGAP